MNKSKSVHNLTDGRQACFLCPVIRMFQWITLYMWPCLHVNLHAWSRSKGKWRANWQQEVENASIRTNYLLFPGPSLTFTNTIFTYPGLSWESQRLFPPTVPWAITDLNRMSNECPTAFYWPCKSQGCSHIVCHLPTSGFTAQP